MPYVRRSVNLNGPPPGRVAGDVTIRVVPTDCELTALSARSTEKFGRQTTRGASGETDPVPGIRVFLARPR